MPPDNIPAETVAEAHPKCETCGRFLKQRTEDDQGIEWNEPRWRCVKVHWDFEDGWWHE